MALSNRFILINHGRTINLQPVGKTLSTPVKEQQLRYKVSLLLERKLLNLQENEVIRYQQHCFTSYAFRRTLFNLVHAENR